MTWKRLEGGTYDPNIDEGISARVADPLWLLARQWQVGEFRGEDAASPVLVEAQVLTAPITKFWTQDEHGNRQTVPRGERGVPLETLAEHEPIARGPARTRLRLESGAALLRRLSAARAPKALMNALRDAYGMGSITFDGLDPVGYARSELLARRSLDAEAVVAAIEDVGGNALDLPELAGLSATAQTAADRAFNAWLAQEALLFTDTEGTRPPAWLPDRLEYRFGVSAELPSGTVELEAKEYPGGRLDWHCFDVSLMPTSLEKEKGKGQTKIRVLPTPLQFAGMPAARWWEFEDNDVDFRDLGAGPEDLARSVVAAYAAVAGDDWFVVPCTLPSGSLARVTKLRVRDDFGRWTNIPATAVRDHATPGERIWRWFELDGDTAPSAGAPPLLFLPPVVNNVEQGRVLEAVEFRRDEMANMAWAIERLVESDAGRAVDRDAGQIAPEPTEREPEQWWFRLATHVPDHWVPLVPVRITSATPQVVLRRGRIAAPAGLEMPETVEGGGRPIRPGGPGGPTDPHIPRADIQPAKGRILEPERPFILQEEEIPFGGIRVTRRFQLARSADGAVHLWVGRQKRPSGGPMKRTPLKFDALMGWTGENDP